MLDQPAPAAGKDGAVLARPFRRPTKPRFAITASSSASWSSSRNQGTGNFRDLMVAVAQDPAHAHLPRRRRQRQRRFQRKFRARNHGDVHHGRRPLHRKGYPRSRARLHRLELRGSEIRRQQRPARRRREDVPRQDRPLRRRRRDRHHHAAARHRRLHRRQDLPLLRARGSVAGASEDNWARCCATTTTRSRRCSKRSSCRAISTAPLRWARRSRARSNSPSSPIRSSASTSIPGVPDFNSATGALGQQLFSPPTVAGWAGGQSWITPGLLLERGNFARDVLFPDISFLPPDRVHRRRRSPPRRRPHPRKAWTSPPPPRTTPRAATWPNRT